MGGPPHSSALPQTGTPWLDALPGDGEMLALVRRHDWAATPLGPPDAWPATLRTVVAVALTSRFPKLVIWGEELVQLYNDAFVPVFAEKHPQVGARVQDTWAEIWDTIGPMMRGVLETREAIWAEDQVFWIDRVGFPEDSYFTFCYSPILDDDGVARGLLATAVETTARVLEERRARLVRDVGAQHAPTVAGAAEAAVAAIGRHTEDLTYAALYRPGADGAYELLAQRGLEDPPPRADERSELGRAGVVPMIVDPLAPVPHTLSGAPTTHAAAVSAGNGVVLVVGLSPTRRRDAALDAFLAQLGAQLEGVLAVAAAIESEHARVDELLALDRAKSAFFANVSHELRTPLTLMLGPLAEALGDPARPLHGAQRERIAAAHRNAGRMLGLVDDLLDFARDGSHVRRPQPRAVALGALTAELAGAFRAAAEEAGLELVIDTPEPARMTPVDPEMWERIVLNLLSNALKFTPAGRIAVRLRDAEDGVRLEVQDTGTGIPAAELRRVFERFHRVPNPAARSAEGSGIGLSLVRRLAEQHGGRAGADSTVGEGSTFWVELPAAAVAVTDAPAAGTGSTVARVAAEARAWSTASAEAGGPEGAPRVLVADDNADMRAHMTSVLQGEFVVRAVPDGRAALDAVHADPPDLVVADAMMPGLDGLELLAALRGDPSTAAIPVLIVSARVGEEAVVAGLEAGADDHIGKPFSAAELRARVRTTIELTRMRAGLEQAAAERARDERLLRAEERFRHAGAAARVGTWCWYPQTGAVDADDTFAGLFGVAPGGIASREDALACIHPDDRSRTGAELSAATPGVSVGGEFRVPLADGATRVLQWRASAAQDGVVHGAVWDATALADARTRIEHLAAHDTLTDLPNRRRFNEELDRALAAAQRHGNPGAVVLFDLDGLKHVNDTLGHAGGDAMIVAVADTLRRRLRETDVAARLSGDEFAVLLEQTPPAEAASVAAELLTAIGAVSPLARTPCSACAGVATFGGDLAIGSAEELLLAADAALYEAKDAGRGQLRVARGAPAAQRAERPRWSRRLRSALDEDRLVLHAQPIVALDGRPGRHLELLLRMVSEDGELQLPSAILPAAERAGMIGEIDRWVVGRAVEELARRRGAGEDVSLAVNLSARSIVDPALAPYVAAQLDAHGIDGDGLIFEVTESSAIMNLERARAFATAVVARGCRLALDDFGAGFTSFHYLKHLDFAIVKIDRAFAADVLSDPVDRALVRAIIGMARDLGKLIVAEGPRDDATIEWLREAGVHFAQSFHLGRPRAL